jgi:hypothetical protein
MFLSESMIPRWRGTQALFSYGLAPWLKVPVIRLKPQDSLLAKQATRAVVR